jgi:hypothetical protein
MDRSNRLRGNAMAALGLLAALAAGCGDAPSGAGGPPVAQLAVQPVLPAVLAGSAFEFAVDRARLRLTRLSGEQVLDSVIFFPADSSQLSVRLKVPILTRSEVMEVALELRSGTRLLFAGSRQVEVTENSSVAPAVPLQYLGPGTEMTSLRLSPRDSVIRPGETFTFGLEAFSLSGPVAAYYAGWSTSDPAVTVNANGTLRAPAARGGVTVRVVSPTGIKDSTRIWFSPPPSGMAITAGDGQSSQAGLQLPILLAVRVVAADLQGVPGIRVRFRSLSGGRVLDTLLITDALGEARTGGILGPAAGSQFFEGEAPGLPKQTFTALAVAGPPSVATAIGGNGQVATVNQLLLSPLTVRVTDGTGNPIAGTPLTWQVTSGGGTLVSVSDVTNLSGVGFADLQVGRLAGANRVRVSIPSGAFAEFVATGRPDAPAALRILSGDLQVEPAGSTLRPFVVEIADSIGNPVPGATVRWRQVEGGGSLSLTLSVADQFGRASTIYRLPTLPGTYHVVAELQDTAVTATFQVTAAAPPP